MVRISDSWYSHPRKDRTDYDMQLTELTAMYLGSDQLWLWADDPPILYGEDAVGMWVCLPVEEAWALVDRLQAELPPRQAVAEARSTQPASEDI